MKIDQQLFRLSLKSYLRLTSGYEELFVLIWEFLQCGHKILKNTKGFFIGVKRLFYFNRYLVGVFCCLPNERKSAGRSWDLLLASKGRNNKI